MVRIVKRLIPGVALGVYHRLLSRFAAFWYGHPSRRMIVIGVTGTNGKTTTAVLTAKALEASGLPTGCTTTALFKIGDREWLNDTKMTMLGRFALQRLLRRMADAGCRYAVVEVSSQAIIQHRHQDISIDAAVLTNLTPEHIEAHGGFENYKRAKIALFEHVASRPPKMIDGKAVPKIAILNRACEHAPDFVKPGFDRVVWYGSGSCEKVSLHRPVQGADVCATNVRSDGWDMLFDLNGIASVIHLPGDVNVENALAALAVSDSLEIPLNAALAKIQTVRHMPGRFERIELGQPFTVLIDYAVEPAAMTRLYAFLENIPHERLIHVFGSCGGGRDVARRPILGRMAAEHADVVILTNEDPYDDDPMTIIRDIENGAMHRSVQGVARASRPQVAIRTNPDRRAAIFDAVRSAKPGDIVLITGKGSEQAIMVAGGRRIPWDDREVAREAIRDIIPNGYVQG